MSIGADNFADAPELEYGANGPTPSAGLTRETGEPNTFLNRTAWWTFTAPDDNPVLFDLTDSIYPGDPFDADTYINIWTGTAVDALTDIAYDDDGAGVGYLSRLTFWPTAGTTYRIQVGSYTSADDMDYVLTVTRLTLGTWRPDGRTYRSGMAFDRNDIWRTSASVTGASPEGLSHEALDNAMAGEGAFDDTGGTFSAVLSLDTRIVDADPESPAPWGGEGFWDVPYQWGDEPAAELGDYAGSVYDLPADVVDPDTGEFVDPTVVGIQWGIPEATGRTTLQPSFTYADYPRSDIEWRFLYRVEAGGGAIPGFRTPGQLVADFTEIDLPITTADADAGSIPETEVTISGYDRFRGDRIIFALADKNYTIDGGTPVDGDSLALTGGHGFKFDYVIPYRLIYKASAGPTPPLRQYPRNDGLAGSARRMWPPPRSRQGSIRRLGGYL